MVFNSSLTRIKNLVFKPLLAHIHNMGFNCVLVRMVSAVFIPLLTRIIDLVFKFIVTLVNNIFPLNYILMLKLVKCKRLCRFLPQYFHPP